MNYKEDLKEIFLQPAKESIEFLEAHLDKLTTEELIMLERLKSSIKIYEIQKAAAMKGRL